ncbi:MAG: hypothetical protein COZ31_09795 [Nitrospirae bacterium CG_4_10_14_3_um_filter_44_29]|nr:hypothetical protein [Nitrospirota bacterium]OIO27295.1 MAG: hypothetical protein AUJ60_09375 [Nitrospirae bacterium CG1_02_44_142]PIP70277.1 MAG: hypothetical protein COW90_06115 [Nitrospirae bacterium CG22_combo_CG10-13_8_21_14_all_44_11]PIV66669.1 MAG: hypothetical protein COS10_05140 [Nitrospirae bacterium CG01_land_8_20_14_3_00_44_22]PIX87541.1 MAG: hypothetical protein COZ31_09795 [Nitrospirae bacterium CG_4_10_14_3_um_filter_44_29]PJA81845.1 MAG: hypothetical protein CO147_07830 [Nit
MTIDVRGLGREELFIRLKEVLISHRGRHISLEVLADSHKRAKEIAAFASMSGCQAELDEGEGRCIVKISGIVCCI